MRLALLVLVLLVLTAGCTSEESPARGEGGGPPASTGGLQPAPVLQGRIAFTSDRAGPFDIYAMNLDGSGLANLTSRFSRLAFQPEWSPDGTRLAFTGVVGYSGQGAHDILVMSADGTHITNLTAEVSRATNQLVDPAWSPDGERIAFERDYPNGQASVFVMNADGSGLQELIDRGHAVGPARSPDGSKLAFWVDAEGGGLRVLDLASERSRRSPRSGNVSARGTCIRSGRPRGR